MVDTINIGKVYCLGDGYAHGDIWPEWPQILQALLPGLEVVTISAIGAGHEFLINKLLQQNIQKSLIIFQWPQHNRFDKLVQDQEWNKLIQSDPVYHFNTYNTNNDTWWCSSASAIDSVTHYHNFYIQRQQSVLRQQNQKILVEAYVKQVGQYVCTSNAEQDLFAVDKKFFKFRGKQIQPAPLLHYHWLIESILPMTTLSVDNAIAQELHHRISSHAWVPYDPDREEIWSKMSKL
jgi:hypothetical protein